LFLSSVGVGEAERVALESEEIRAVEEEEEEVEVEVEEEEAKARASEEDDGRRRVDDLWSSRGGSITALTSDSPTRESIADEEQQHKKRREEGEAKETIV
jgi:hypothetical protein